MKSQLLVTLLCGVLLACSKRETIPTSVSAVSYAEREVPSGRWIEYEIRDDRDIVQIIELIRELEEIKLKEQETLSDNYRIRFLDANGNGVGERYYILGNRTLTIGKRHFNPHRLISCIKGCIRGLTGKNHGVDWMGR